MIKRRTATRTPKKHNLRHPMLKPGSPAAMLFRYIAENPGCSTRELRAIYPSGDPITKMVNEGLIEKKGGHGNTRYWIIPVNETGQGRDKVEIEIMLFVNSYGEYSIRARMIGQHHTAHEDHPRELLAKTVYLYPPRPEEPYAKREAHDVNQMPDKYLPQPKDLDFPSGPLIVEADYSIISDDKK